MVQTVVEVEARSQQVTKIVGSAAQTGALAGAGAGIVAELEALASYLQSLQCNVLASGQWGGAHQSEVEESLGWGEARLGRAETVAAS